MRRKNHIPATSAILEKVITAAEAARLFRKSKSTVTYATDRGLIASKRCGGIVLVDIESAAKLWGEPNKK